MPTHQNRTIHLYARISFLSAIAFLCILGYASAEDNLPDRHHAETSTTGFSAIKFYQNFISRADGQRCPMYPSCSHYAKTAIEKHGFLKGWVLASDRLLRCGRNETGLSPLVYSEGKPHTYDPLSENTFWWKKP